MPHKIAKRAAIKNGATVRNQTTNNVPYGNLSEHETVRRAKKGDVLAYERLYHLHKRRIFHLCLSMTRNVLDAEDLTQDVFLQLHRKLATFRGESTLSTWLYRMAINLVLMHFRKEHLLRVFVDENATDTEETALSQIPDNRHPTSSPVERLALTRALSNLSDGKRTVFVLHDVIGLTHNEVAQKLGFTSGCSKSQLHRAHVDLRAALRQPSRRRLVAVRCP